MTDVSNTKDIMPTANEMENMYLSFKLGNEAYGIEVRYVIQIVGMQDITQMPEMPPFMKGYINMRGSIIPVVSMRQRFGKADEAEYTDRTCIIVVQVCEKEIGLIVDAIQETITIEPDDISPPPTVGSSASDSYIIGIARLPDGHTSTLINMCNLFDETQI